MKLFLSYMHCFVKSRNKELYQHKNFFETISYVFLLNRPYFISFFFLFSGLIKLDDYKCINTLIYIWINIFSDT